MPLGRRHRRGWPGGVNRIERLPHCGSDPFGFRIEVRLTLGLTGDQVANSAGSTSTHRDGIHLDVRLTNGDIDAATDGSAKASGKPQVLGAH